jgi:gas vesicle protein
MPDKRDTTDFITAFAVGAALGVGAALLLRPDNSPSKRILRELAPYRRQFGKSARRAKKSFSRGASASAKMGDNMSKAGRVLARELREELSDLLETAREEISSTLKDQLRQATRAARRGAQRVSR